MTKFEPGGHRGWLDAIDITKPNVARVYDYFVGGKDNFGADRDFADQAMRIAPKAPLAARANREFLRRVICYLVGSAGITQLIDIGSGLPTAGNVSEVAHSLTPMSTSCTSITTRSFLPTARPCSPTGGPRTSCSAISGGRRRSWTTLSWAS